VDELWELDNESCATNEPWGSGTMGEFGKVEPWMYSVKKPWNDFLLFYLSIKGNVHPQDDISFGKVETTTNNENKPQLVIFSSTFELSQPAPFHSVFKLSQISQFSSIVQLSHTLPYQ
jgi:hypothetical protein